MAGAASSSASARAACSRMPRSSATWTPTGRRCSSRRSTRSCLWAADPPTISRAILDHLDRPHAIPELGQGIIAKPYQRPHPPIVVTAVAPFSKGVTAAAARGLGPDLGEFLLPEWVKTHWPKYVEGCATGGRRPTPPIGASPRASSSPTTPATARRYATDPDFPIISTTTPSSPSSNAAAAAGVFKTHPAQPDTPLTVEKTSDQPRDRRHPRQR